MGCDHNLFPAACICDNFNPRSPSGLRPKNEYIRQMLKQISIHAARVGCDRWLLPMAFVLYDFNPRSPSGLRLQISAPSWKCWGYFNPRSPSGLRQMAEVAGNSLQKISIHAARVGCDKSLPPVGHAYNYFNPRSPSGLRQSLGFVMNSDQLLFQSTQPEWAATEMLKAALEQMIISIHAARVGCD